MEVRPLLERLEDADKPPRAQLRDALLAVRSDAP
jgi:hypothetical protein